MDSERLELASALRAKGLLWTDVAAVLRSRYRINGIAALRLAHGWSQREVAELWSARWPDDMKTFKTISYWECWPAPTGHAPSLPALSRLAELYQCAVSDLVEGLGDFRCLDEERPVEPDGLFSCCVFCQATKLNPACL